MSQNPNDMVLTNLSKVVLDDTKWVKRIFMLANYVWLKSSEKSIFLLQTDLTCYNHIRLVLVMSLGLFCHHASNHMYNVQPFPNSGDAFTYGKLNAGEARWEKFAF